MRYFLTILLLVIITGIAIAGFRGSKFSKPPLEIFPDMDRQPRLKPQSEFSYWDDRRADRLPVAGTVTRGNDLDVKSVFEEDYKSDRFRNPSFYTAKDESGEFLAKIPVPVTMEFIKKGREKYNIFCAVCHGESGNGNGVTTNYGVAGSMNYHVDNVRNMADGEIYNIIENGIRQMKGYGDKLEPEERWAVVAYVRALQKSQTAGLEDVPQAQRAKLESEL